MARAYEVRPLLPSPLEDLSDCRHGCNGYCVEFGSDRCNFTCHGFSGAWADWLSPEDALYDQI